MSSIATFAAASTPIRWSLPALVRTFPRLPTKGGYNVDEAYAEINAPLLADRPFFQLLELDAAVRFSDYSTLGFDDHLQGRRQLEADPRPALPRQLFGRLPSADHRRIVRNAVALRPGADRSLLGRRIPTGAILANCTAQGVPAGYVQNNPQISVITGGNQNLKPETSKGWVLGAVLSPTAIPRFSVEANYYKIKLKGAIQGGDAGAILERCVSQQRCARLRPDHAHGFGSDRQYPGPAAEHRRDKHGRRRP